MVGSHGKGSWWYAGVREHEKGVWGEGDLAEMLDDAADTAIRDMTKAGLDVITDGEVRRLDGYVDSYYTVIQNIQPIEIKRKDGPWGYDQQTRYVATGKIGVPEGGLGIIDEFKYTMAHTDKPLKATCAGPLTFGSRIHPGDRVQGHRRHRRAVLRGHQRGAEGAGGGRRRVHPDRRAGPRQRLRRGDGPPLQQGDRGRQREAGVPHLLRQPLRAGPLRAGLRQLLPGRPGGERRPVRAGVRRRELSEIEKAGEWLSDGRELGAGLIDVKNFYTDTPEDVAKRIHTALKYVKPEKLWVNPDCGFGWSPRYMCNQKIGALAAGAKLARKQLNG